jgi:hypothetical protein
MCIQPPNGHSPHHGFSQEQKNLAPADPPLPNREVDVENAVAVPDAQSAPNEVGIYPQVGVECRTDNIVTALRRFL